MYKVRFPRLYFRSLPHLCLEASIYLFLMFSECNYFTSLSDFEHVRDHPIQFAPDPSKRFTQEDNVPKKVTNPQRVWEREHYVPNVNYTSQQFNNWPTCSREAGEHYYRPNGTGYVRSQPSTALTSSNGPSTSNVQKVVKTFLPDHVSG